MRGELKSLAGYSRSAGVYLPIKRPTGRKDLGKRRALG